MVFWKYEGFRETQILYFVNEKAHGLSCNGIREETILWG
jgi:hypothetical protein